MLAFTCKIVCFKYYKNLFFAVCVFVAFLQIIKHEIISSNLFIRKNKTNLGT